MKKLDAITFSKEHNKIGIREDCSMLEMFLLGKIINSLLDTYSLFDLEGNPEIVILRYNEAVKKALE